MKRNSLLTDSQKENILMWISGKFIPDKTNAISYACNFNVIIT